MLSKKRKKQAKIFYKHASSYLLNFIYFFSTYQISTRSLSLDAITTEQIIWLGLLFGFSYNANYFINAYSDRKDDMGKKSVNLYIDKQSKPSFWWGFSLNALISIFITLQISVLATVSYLAILTYQIFYSLPPVRLKAITRLRFFALGFFYVLKTLYILHLLCVPFHFRTYLFLMLIFLFVSTSSIVYKTYFYKTKKRLPVFKLSMYAFILAAFAIFSTGWFGINTLWSFTYILIYLVSASLVFSARELLIRKLGD